MVLFVYSVISPLINFVLGFIFLALGTLLRHQFLHVYPTVPDSGGKIWAGFIKIMVTCMIIAEVTSKWFGVCVAAFWRRSHRVLTSDSFDSFGFARFEESCHCNAYLYAPLGKYACI